MEPNEKQRPDAEKSVGDTDERLTLGRVVLYMVITIAVLLVLIGWSKGIDQLFETVRAWLS